MEWYTIITCEECGEYTEIGSKDIEEERMKKLLNIGLFVEKHKHCDIYVTESHDIQDAIGSRIDWAIFKGDV